MVSVHGCALIASFPANLFSFCSAAMVSYDEAYPIDTLCQSLPHVCTLNASPRAVSQMFFLDLSPPTMLPFNHDGELIFLSEMNQPTQIHAKGKA